MNKKDTKIMKSGSLTPTYGFRIAIFQATKKRQIRCRLVVLPNSFILIEAFSCDNPSRSIRVLPGSLEILFPMS